MFTLPDHLRAPLSNAVADYIPTFAPQRLLTVDQWDRCDIAVWTSCATTLPSSREDAKTQMSITCAFLAFTDKVVGEVDLTKVLTEDLIDRFLIESKGRVSEETRRNRQVRLRRALKASRGETRRIAPAPTCAVPQPYDGAELSRLAVAAMTSPELAVALALGLGAGVTVPAAYGATPPPSSVTAGMLHLMGMESGWAQRPIATALTPGGWTRARGAAADCGVTLSKERLRATWVGARLSCGEPFAVTATGLSRRDLDNAAANAAAPDDDEARLLLRG